MPVFLDKQKVIEERPDITMTLGMSFFDTDKYGHVSRKTIRENKSISNLTMRSYQYKSI